MENQLSKTFMEQFKNSPLVDRSARERRFVDAISKFAHTATTRKELIPMPIEIYWPIAFGPLYQLVKFHISKSSMLGSPPFIFDEEKINLTLSLVIKALKP